ncbi:hypothetical protein TNCV_4029711 [Trichonephila clavipes]|nr:hypothetical protein TNCV_4029711 [Trichonephila clavipes]
MEPVQNCSLDVIPGVKSLTSPFRLTAELCIFRDSVSRDVSIDADGLLVMTPDFIICHYVLHEVVTVIPVAQQMM